MYLSGTGLVPTQTPAEQREGHRDGYKGTLQVTDKQSIIIKDVDISWTTEQKVISQSIYKLMHLPPAPSVCFKTEDVYK